jgi:(4-(4-[2-(gamma-L-glutamylamino)ethyl]phenoxymethyl)furan-2-yl)methanamine synthase
MSTIGWDIGGVNTKVARVSGDRVIAVRSRPFELQRDPAALVQVLRTLATEVGASSGDVHAVTMTAELSQMFRTKREGVSFVLESVEAAFPSCEISVYAVDGRFLSPAEARSEPLAIAAANWAATARLVSRYVSDAVLVDIGTTSTDIVPIVGGVVVATGWTDPDRLASGELVYTGAVRTPVEAIRSHVPVGSDEAGLSAEGFALAGDVHVWRGDLAPADYTAPTPDGRPATREFAGERLARAICADRELLDAAGVNAIADALADAQVTRIADAIVKVCARHPTLHTAVVTGLGDFIGRRAAQQAGLRVVALASELGEAAARCAPAASVALLLDDADRRAGALAPASADPRRLKPALDADKGVVQTVVKIGGGLLAHEGCLDAVLAVIGEVARERPLLLVPGGGPFADAVRAQDDRLGLSDEAAHWMAVLAMDQYAHLIASRLPGATLVCDEAEIASAVRSGRIPVLAPSSWLRRADPLPHSWNVTSDSIAAWVAGEVAAKDLVLIKPPHATGADLVDPYFARTSEGVRTEVIPAHHIETLRLATRR